jgi:hypothetical protein
MAELARAPQRLQRLFQTIDLAPLPQDQIAAKIAVFCTLTFDELPTCPD